MIPASRAAWFVLGAGLAATPGQIRPIAAHDLRVSLAEIDSNGVRLLRLRTFMDTSGSPWMLAVDPFSLEPSLHRRFGWMETGRPLEVLDSTPWGRLRRVELDFGWRTAGLSRILGRDRGIVLSGDAKAQGIGAMTDTRWAQFYAMASSQGVYPKGLDYKSAYTLQFLPTGVN